jgi:hypothetical protein
MREKDDLHKGKDDWMSYQKRRDMSEEERLADQKANDTIAAKKLEKIEKAKSGVPAKKEDAPAKKKIRSYNPDGGFQLG